MTCGIEGKHNPQKSCHDAVIQQELWCSDCTTAFIHRAWAPGEGVREHNCGSELLETVLTYPGQFSTEVTTRPLKEAALAQRTLPAMDVKWDSVKWPDGSTYEGLVRDEKCDVRGVFSYPNGDRYEGEFMENHMDGYGVFVWTNGTIYRGEWQKSKMQGCGVKLARRNGKNGVSFTAEEGHFMDDEWVGDVMACSVEQSRAAAYEADMAAKMARAFEVSQRVKPSDMVATRADGSAGGPSLRVAKEAAQVAARDEGKRWFGIF